MGTIVKHFLIGGVVGLVLAGIGGLTWWGGAVALGASPSDQVPALLLALGLGVFAGCCAGALTSALLRPSPPAPAKKEVAKPPPVPRKRRRHPLDRHALRARIAPNLRWLKLSKTFVVFLRGAKGRFVGKAIFDFVHPEDVPAVEKALTLAKTTKQGQQVSCRFAVALAQQPAAARNGTRQVSPSDTALLPLWAPSSVVHVRMEIWAKADRSGKVRWYDCRFTDLTPVAAARARELETARKVIAKLKRRWHALGDDLARLKLSYRELYQHAPVMYFSMDDNGKLVTFNDTLVRTLGFERAELQNKNYTVLLAPAMLKSYVTIAEAMPAQEGERETQWRKKDGTRIDVWLHSLPVVDEAGQVVRYRSAALDLTEKNRLANELRARGDELERTNQRLRTINSELEAFTHVVSHDLKEPLRTLQAYSHILAEEHGAALGPDGFQYINHLIRASQRLGALIDELLNLSQAGRITHAPKAFNLIEIVATVRQDLVGLIQRKEAIVLTEGSLPDIAGDPVRITQLLTNLVANGLKYNQNPSPKVVIGAMPCPDELARVTVFVRDNGIGIDAAFHSQIFGIFRRLHQADEFEGTGAGLAICKKIVEGHGGRIWVESQPGQGATFYFTLPRVPIVKPAGAGPKASPSSRQRKTAIHSDSPNGKTPPHIVLVEDQADVGMIIQKLGKRDGLAITWFPTAEEAWDYLRSNRADLLLFDVNLPGMDGVELCRRIRVLDHLKDTPVAMFTPDQEADKLDTLRAAGADYFLTKDLLCEPAQWQQRIKELLEQISQPSP